MITFVKGAEKGICLHEVDVKGWLDAGWKPEGEEEKPKRGPKPKEEKEDKK